MSNLRITDFYLRESIKKITKSVLQRLNLDVRRVEHQVPPNPILFEDPIEALRYVQGERQAAFVCPIKDLTYLIGFGLAPKGWHPFLATLQEYRSGLSTCYGDSILKTYYESWQPQNAQEAYAGFNEAPKSFAKLAPHLLYLLPWRSHDPSEVTRNIEYWSSLDNLEHGRPDLHFLKHGLGFFGPTATAKGELEYRRLIYIYEEIKIHGYNRSYGDINLVLLRRGSEFRYITDGQGYHRAIAIAALDHETLPARFRNPFIIDVKDADYWPQVRSGIWERSEAVAYFNYLFDFDSYSWASERGLLLEQQHPLKIEA